MNIPYEILLVTSGVGALHSAFFGVYLFTQKKGRNIANTLLAILLIVFAIRMTKSVSYYFSEGHSISTILMNLGYAANLAILPLLWLYLKAFLEKDYRFQWRKDFFHLLPAAVIILLCPILTDRFWMQLHGYTLSLVLTGLYLPFCFLLIRKNITTIKGIQKIWIMTFFVGVSIVWGCYTVNFIFGLIPYITAPVIFSFIIYFMSYLGLKQGDIFSKGAKYLNSSHSTEQLEKCFEELQALLENQKLYKDSTLTLPKAAGKLAVTPNLLSESINKMSGHNFPDFINKYRVKEAQILLSNRDHDYKKIATIAFETGFNSASVFNAAFKKFTTMTPSEFRKFSLNEESPRR
jgi:AraC-like DNA-binding protein